MNISKREARNETTLPHKFLVVLGKIGGLLCMVLALYTLTADTASAQQTCGGTIAYNQTHQQKNHEHWAHCDYFFQGRAGDIIEIKVDVLSGNLRPQIILYAPNHEGIAQEPGNKLRFRLNHGDGSYVFRVTSYGNPITYGMFSISFRKISPQTCGGPIAYNQTYQHENHEYWAHCDYFFQGKAGDIIEVKVTVLRGNLKPQIILLDSYGRPIAQSLNDWLSYPLIHGSGPYQFRVSSYGSPRTYGEFYVSLRKIPPAPQPSPYQIRKRAQQTRIGSAM